MSIYLKILVLFLCILPTLSTAQEKVAEGINFIAYLDSPCNSHTNVKVVTSDAGIANNQAIELQKAISLVRFALELEKCPIVQSFDVNVLLGSTNKLLFKGKASKNQDWKLVATDTSINKTSTPSIGSVAADPAEGFRRALIEGLEE